MKPTNPGEWMIQATTKLEEMSRHLDEHRSDFKEYREHQREQEDKRGREFEDFKKDYYTFKGKVTAWIVALGALLTIIGSAFISNTFSQKNQPPVKVIQRK